MPFNFIAIARDVTVLFVLVFASSFLAVQLIGAMGAEATLDMIGLSSLFWGVVGFTISGCLARGNRWRHLAVVALVFWLVCLVNVVLGLTPVTTWAVGSVLILTMMGLGGGLSYLFVRTPQATQAVTNGQTTPPTEESGPRS
jgi:hypothetical protein